MMLMNPSFWVAVSFFTLIALIGKRVYGMMIQGLDEQSQAIEKEIIEAQNLKNKAETYLAEQKKLYEEAHRRAEEIISHAHLEVTRLKKQAEEDIQFYLKNEERLLETRIQRAENLIYQDIKQQLIELSLGKATDSFKKTFNLKNQNALNLEVFRKLSSRPPVIPPQAEI